MALIVQKYGGTSVGTSEKLKNVASKVISQVKAGNQLVVVVSAMGPTTDVLIGKMKELTSAYDPREYDALVSIGENESAALLAQAIIAQGQKAISLTGWQAGICRHPRFQPPIASVSLCIVERSGKPDNRVKCKQSNADHQQSPGNRGREI